MSERAQWLRDTLRPVISCGRYYRNRAAPRTSYAADSEDVAAGLLLGNIGRFIDIGANDGITLSNTASMAFRGARGLCFEPNPVDYRRLRALYRWTGRMECVAEGISDRDASMELRCDGLLSAMTATEDTGLTTLLARFNRPDAPTVSVPVQKLSSWLDRRPLFYGCDLISIDVEGHELNVLRGIDWHRHSKPARCLIIETHAHGENNSWVHRDFEAIEELLGRWNYRKVAASANNTFWLHDEDLSQAKVSAAQKCLPGYDWFDQ